METTQKMKNLDNNNNINTNNINNKKKLIIPPKLNLQLCENLSRQKSTEQSSHFYTSRGTSKQFSRNKNHVYYSQEVFSTERKGKFIPNNKIYDLSSTFKLNFQIISNCLDTTQLNEAQKILFQKKFQKIMSKFKEFQSIRESKGKQRGINLLNSQVLEESKRNIKEKDIYYESKINQIESDINKKETFLRKKHKKLNEIQIYIRRESQNFPMYKRIYANYSIDNFILENENMLRLRDKLRNYMVERNESISVLLLENLQLVKSNFKINMKNKLLIDQQKIRNIKFNNFISVKNEIISNEENNIQKIQKIYKKLSYKVYKILLEKKKNCNNLYIECSCSDMTFPQNDEITDTNISKYFNDITIIEKTKNNDENSGVSFSRLDPKIK